MNEPSTLFTIFTLLVSVVFAVSCYTLAKKKERNEKLWAILGLFFGALALLIIVFLPKKQNTIKTPIQETSGSIASIQSEAAQPFDTEDSYELPKAPRIPGSKSLNWYYINAKKDDEIKGPFSINTLRKEIFDNKLDGSTYIWCEELEDWALISEFSNCNLILDPDFIE